MNPQQLVVQVVTGYIGSAARYFARRLDIASRLEGGSKSVAELAADPVVMTRPASLSGWAVWAPNIEIRPFDCDKD